MGDKSAARPPAIGVGAIAAFALKAPIHAYRWTLKAFFGFHCRHLPTCSAYALEAIDTNGAWRGFWLTISRLSRCRPWGTSGYDPVPDIARERHVLMPWRYGRWTGRHLAASDIESEAVCTACVGERTSTAETRAE